MPDASSKTVSEALPSVASEEAVLLLEWSGAGFLVGDEGFFEVALENQAKGLDTFLVGGGGGRGVGLVSDGGGGGG